MNLIRDYRMKVNWTQLDLARRSGFGDSQGRISNYENDLRQPSLSDMRAIVKALNEAGVECSLDDVFPPEGVAA